MQPWRAAGWLAARKDTLRVYRRAARAERPISDSAVHDLEPTPRSESFSPDQTFLPAPNPKSPTPKKLLQRARRYLQHGRSPFNPGKLHPYSVRPSITRTPRPPSRRHKSGTRVPARPASAIPSCVSACAGNSPSIHLLPWPSRPPKPPASEISILNPHLNRPRSCCWSKRCKCAVMQTSHRRTRSRLLMTPDRKRVL